MGRRHLWILILLGLIVATPASALDFRGVDSAVLAVNPPAGYCIVPTADHRYDDLRNLFTRWEPQSDLKAMFLPCGSPGGRPLLQDSVVYVAVPPQGRGPRASDRERTRWLAELPLPQASYRRQVARDKSDDAVVYFHMVETDQQGQRPHATIVTAVAVTVIQNTPIEVESVRLLDPDDAVGAATALDEARGLLKAAVKRLGEDNRLDLVNPITAEQVEASSNLGYIAFTVTVGGLLVLTLTVQRLWVQAVFSVVMALAGFLVYRAAPGATEYFRHSGLNMLVWSVAAVVFVGLVNIVWVLANFIRVRRIGLADRLRSQISARRWAGGAPPESASADFTKRWFVTVAAATGSVVFAMLMRPGFAEELAQSFVPSRIVFTLAITVVSVTLIGPVEEFIFGSRIAAAAGPAHDAAHGEPPAEDSRFERLIGLFASRTLGRFALVLVFMLMLTVMHGTIEARVHGAEGGDIATMLAASVGPAIITYYWCAALQHGVRSVAWRSGLAAALAGLLILGIPRAIVAGGDAASLQMLPMTWIEGDHFRRAMAEVSGSVGAMVAAFGSFALLAFAGGVVIDRARGRADSPFVTVGLICAALLAMVLIFVLVSWSLARLMHIEDVSLLAKAGDLLAIVGWMIGLVVSGFPNVLRSGAERTATDAAAGG